MVHFTTTAVALIFASVAVFTADAVPNYLSSTYSNTVGLGETCDDYNRICRTDQQLYCLAIPGKTGRTCVKLASNGQACNSENVICDDGLTCNIAPGQWAGTCGNGGYYPPAPAPGNYPAPAPAPETVTVGLGNTCGGNLVCTPGLGLTCDCMPGQTQTICVKITYNEGGFCNNEHTKCGNNMTCRISPDQWAGKCIKDYGN